VDLGPLQRNLFAVRNDAHRHRRARTEAAGKKIVGSRTFVIPASINRFVSDESMFAGGDVVAKTLASLENHGAHD
jgi:hypothetical protein